MTRLAVVERHHERRLVAVVEDGAIDVARSLGRAGLPAVGSLQQLIELGTEFWQRAAGVLTATAGTAEPFDESALAAPFSPGAIVCGGANFADHLRETGRGKPERVEFFFKSPATVIGPRDDVRMSRALSSKYDYEVELGIVVGRRARDVAVDEALNYVFGYCVLNDVSIRDHQIVLDDDGTSHGRFGQGKNFRDACSIGPWVVTADALGPLEALELTTRVDGELRQRSSMKEAIWNVAELVAYYSSVVTLHPGWVIAAGTPGGPALGSDVELRADPYRRSDGVQRGGYVQDGQVVECQISRIGSLVNRYVVED
jgi:2-keto-4-pentenoate hydratase/2-oxohepta-3-ene-1,7-dioic acid hydratase in catechol pathway